jgi:hypothetical protein
VRETWQPVLGYEGLYEVSDRGRVRSLPRTIYLDNGHTRRWSGKTLIGHRRDSGYREFALYLDKKVKVRNVHQLVLEAFVGPRPLGKEVAHKDGNPSNSVLQNLKWVTKVENHSDRLRHGTYGFKLTLNQVRKIQKDYLLLDGGIMSRCHTLSRKYSVSTAYIHTLVSRGGWRR